MSIFLKSNFKVAKYCAAKDRIYCMNLSAPFLCQFFKDQVNQPINQSINQLPTFQTQSELTKSRHGITACDLDKLLLLLLYFIFSIIPFKCLINVFSNRDNFEFISHVDELKNFLRFCCFQFVNFQLCWSDFV